MYIIKTYVDRQIFVDFPGYLHLETNFAVDVNDAAVHLGAEATQESRNGSGQNTTHVVCVPMAGALVR